MSKMGKYCKAYIVRDFRQFQGWAENARNLIKEKKQVDGKEVDEERDLGDEDILYLQENFVVTDGIFIDENVIFDQVDPEWVEFCKSTLAFEMPVYEPVVMKEPD
jgi:hypothetical protein